MMVNTIKCLVCGVGYDEEESLCPNCRFPNISYMNDNGQDELIIQNLVEEYKKNHTKTVSTYNYEEKSKLEPFYEQERQNRIERQTRKSNFISNLDVARGFQSFEERLTEDVAILASKMILGEDYIVVGPLNEQNIRITLNGREKINRFSFLRYSKPQEKQQMEMLLRKFIGNSEK